MSRAAIMQPMDDAAAIGRLALQRCSTCRSVQYPPRELCGACLSPDLVWEVYDGVEGTVLAVTALHHSQEAEFRPALPLRVGMVRLAFGAAAVCFVPGAETGVRVWVTAAVDAHHRAVLTAEVTP